MVVSLKFRGSNCLRQRLILSLLTGKNIIIEDIRPDDDERPGLNEHEENLLDLVRCMTCGTDIKCKALRLQFTPGTLIGGEFTHDCHTSRSISYYLEFILSLAPFCRKPISATLTGVTNDQTDPTVDAVKYSAIPVMKKFIGDVEGTKLDIQISARGFRPDGGGKVLVTCPIVRQLQPVQFTDPGKPRRIRGIAVASRVSPQMANRLIDRSKGTLLDLLADIYIYSDHNKGKSSGLSPGFCLTLSAETTEGSIYTASAASNHKGSGLGPSVPEDTAQEATRNLLGEIHRGGCVDSICQSLALTLMAFNQKDVSAIKFGSLTVYTIQYLRHLKEFCGLTFKLEAYEGGQVVATCQGIGFKNLSKPTY